MEYKRCSSCIPGLGALTGPACYQATRCLSLQAEAQPVSMPGEAKSYHPKIQKIVDDIANLTLVEAADLNELLQKTLNIKDAPMMAMGMSASGDGKKEVASKEEEEVDQFAAAATYTVHLNGYDPPKKITIVKEIRKLIEGLNIAQARQFVEELPQPIKGNLSKDDAEKLKNELEALGAQCTIE
ncbi:MRPL12 [Cordylochernes scorpioides]|uniref:MRPL12 n=1 Tax=Cordylochernes scorpioides TaxID=51811 RepID=A0ABY6LTA7_9ARAC|nr:MRPL12 [Cordylochernes scorpioides]